MCLNRNETKLALDRPPSAVGEYPREWKRVDLMLIRPASASITLNETGDPYSSAIENELCTIFPFQRASELNFESFFFELANATLQHCCDSAQVSSKLQHSWIGWHLRKYNAWWKRKNLSFLLALAGPRSACSLTFSSALSDSKLIDEPKWVDFKSFPTSGSLSRLSWNMKFGSITKKKCAQGSARRREGDHKKCFHQNSP